MIRKPKVARFAPRWSAWVALCCVLGFSACLWAQGAKKLADQMKAAKDDDRKLLSARDDLAKMGKEGATALESVLADASAPGNVRVNAALGLVKMAEEAGGAFGTAELAKYTGDKNPAVRYLAIKGLVNPASRYANAKSVIAEGIKDPATPIRVMVIKYLAERKENPQALAEVIINPKEDREVKEDAEKAFEGITTFNYGFTIAVKRDPNNPKSTVPDPDKEQAAIEKYQAWLKKNPK